MNAKVKTVLVRYSEDVRDTSAWSDELYKIVGRSGMVSVIAKTGELLHQQVDQSQHATTA